MSYDFMDKQKPVSMERNTLGVDGMLYQRLLSKLDEAGPKGKPSAKRIFRRLGYTHPRLVLNIESEGHNSIALIVASRNLSQGGASILHSNFMYPGTFVTLDLLDKHGNIAPQHGVVKRCEHRGGRVHEIGIKFDEDISLRNFLHPSVDLLLHARERINPESMNQKLLIYTEDPEFSSVIRGHLMESSLCYTFAKSTEEALKKAEGQDMILCSVDQAANTTPALVSRFREDGFKYPILLAGKPKDPNDLPMLSACGADMIIPWPCDDQTLLCSLGEYTLNEWTPDSLETIRSCVSPETKQALKMEIAKIGVTLDQQVRTDKRDQVSTSVSRIGVMAPVLGLGSMKETIQSLTQRVNSDEPLADLAGDLAEISSICKSLNNAAA